MALYSWVLEYVLARVLKPGVLFILTPPIPETGCISHRASLQPSANATLTRKWYMFYLPPQTFTEDSPFASSGAKKLNLRLTKRHIER